LTVKGRLTGVKSFYQANYIELPKLGRTGDKAAPLQEHKEIPKIDDIRDVLAVCDTLEKAIILVGASSGLAINEICELKIGDFKKGYDKETGITTLQLRRGKVDYDFVTFLTPEASKAVNDYLSFRGREAKSGERRHNQVKKQRVFSDGGYLFICRRVRDSYLKTKDEELRKLSEKTLMNTYRQLSDDANKSAGKGIRNVIRSHNMRKYFNSALLNAGADIFFTDFLMGHTIDKTRSAYFRASPEQLKEQYKKFLPFLTIEKSLNISESEDYKRIKGDNGSSERRLSVT